LGDGHLNIVHADEVLLTKTHVGLVMEYVAGGCNLLAGTNQSSSKSSSCTNSRCGYWVCDCAAAVV
jgi:hypothetical protein